jgi:hypothetical protein
MTKRPKEMMMKTCSLSEPEPSIGSSFLLTDVDEGEEEEEVPDTPGQTQMPTLPPLPEPRRSPRHHGEANKPVTKDADSQSTLSDARTVGPSTMLAVP